VARSERQSVFLLTDFGAGSVYVGLMKAVLGSALPGADLIDLAHDIAPGPPAQVISEGAFILSRSYRYVPSGSVLCCVVDPGVGTDRGVLGVEVPGPGSGGGWTLVGPDNGLFADVVDREPGALVYRVTDRSFCLSDCSSTFHGRDLFAPLAGLIASGARLSELGGLIAPDDMCRRQGARASGGSGTVRMVDHFGNLVTDVVPPGGLPAVEWLEVAGVRICVTAKAFELAGPGAEFVTLGGLGTLEVCSRSASAAAALGVGRGAPVRVGYSAPSGAQRREEVVASS
jgi:S-adenosylmethionine hydrolase